MLFNHAISLLGGVLPGTLWCGLGDKAVVFGNLGERSELDRCCRAHDHCPIKLRSGATKYGTTNNNFATV